MVVEIKVPGVGESITEVQVAAWVKQVGDPVALDETVAELETDKVTVDLPAPAAGVITEILVEQGESAAVGAVIAYLEEGEAAVPAAEEEREPEEPAPVPAATGKALPGGDDGEPRVMPAARRLLAEEGLEPGDVKATGPGGRLLKEDVLRHRETSSPDAGPAAEPAAPTGATAPDSEPPLPETRQEEVVPMTRLRRRVAERLVASQQEAALLTTFNEADMSAVMALRRAHREAFLERHGVKLGIMSFFVKAAIEALKLIPQLNAEIRDHNTIYKNYFDIGIAVGGGKGLVVPVVRNADRLSFAELEKSIADFAARARENALTLAELQGGTFTISNGGIYGSMLSTPIINPPQTGILGLHKIQERPVAVDGQVVIRPMMYLALTYDHRIVDGREAVTFLVRIKECLENPARILLEV